MIPSAAASSLYSFTRLCDVGADELQHIGAGLGLTIARDIARLHGGDVVLVDDPPDPGACFEVQLPPSGTGRDASSGAAS